MSTSRAIKKRKRDDTQLANYTPMPERAPSVERADTPAIARVIAMVGLFLTVLGTLAMFAPKFQRAPVISPGWGFFFTSIGVVLLLYTLWAASCFGALLALAELIEFGRFRGLLFL